MSNSKKPGPVVIDLEEINTTGASHKPSPADVLPVPELEHDLPQGQAMQSMAELAARRPSRLSRFFLWAVVTLLGFAVSLAFWDFATGLLERNLWLGRIAMVLIGAVLLGLAGLLIGELAAIARLRRIDSLRAMATQVQNSGDMKDATTLTRRLTKLYKPRNDMRWALQRLADQQGDALDAETLMTICETTVISQLDAQALNQIEVASRQVATTTALIPLALMDVAIALTSNIRMIRHIAEIYGGRAGSFGSWRLLKSVATHLVATGAVAIGDDMIGSIAGGGLLSKLSRRFGEGLVNGALTARVGIAAMEVCRPLPFQAVAKPSVSTVVKRALAGLFGA